MIVLYILLGVVAWLIVGYVAALFFHWHEGPTPNINEVYWVISLGPISMILALLLLIVGGKISSLVRKHLETFTTTS